MAGKADDLDRKQAVRFDLAARVFLIARVDRQMRDQVISGQRADIVLHNKPKEKSTAPSVGNVGILGGAAGLAILAVGEHFVLAFAAW